MKTVICFLLILLLGLYFTVPASADEATDRFYAWDLAAQSLTPEDLQSIWQQTMPPHEAAQKLHMAMNFTTFPVVYARRTHRLFYQLGQLTHSSNAVWTPQTVLICDELEKYTAFFATLGNLQARQQIPATLAALSTPGIIPQTDRAALNNLTEKPQWTIRRGKNFQAVIVLLPQHGAVKIKLSANQPVNDNMQYFNIERSVQKIVYTFSGNKWQYVLEPADKYEITDNMQFYLLTLKIPENLPGGFYTGAVILDWFDHTKNSILSYTLKITD